MLSIKHKKSTLSFFKKAVEATRTNSEGKFKGDRLSLVGLAYATDMLDTEIPVQTELSDVLFHDKGLDVVVTLKPLPKQLESVATLADMLKSTGMGYFPDDVDIQEPLFKTPFKADLLLGNTMFSNLQEYRLALTMDDVDVSLLETTIKGTPHYQFVLEDKRQLIDGEVNQHLVLLFKPYEYDGENLMTLISEPKGEERRESRLGKRDTRKVIESVMEPNITGYLVGSVSLLGKYGTAGATIYPTNTNTQIAESDTDYHFICDSGVVVLDKADIRYSNIIKVATDKYVLNLYTNDGQVALSLG